jgi:RsiW-degrading membrane proteinase PrsW (M82 family)
MSNLQYGGYHTATDQRSGNTVEVVIAWILTVLTLGYFLPWAIGATRGKSNSLAILLINFLLGWTFIGWVAALVMACTSHQLLAVNPYSAVVNVHHPPFTSVAPPSTSPAIAAGPAYPAIASSSNPTPGWYAQPNGAQRWWDGSRWTEHVS